MITSKNVVLEVQFKNFLFHGKVIFPSRDHVFHFFFFQFFKFHVLNHSINYQNCGTTWVLALEIEYIFEYIFWITNHLVMKHNQLIAIVIRNIFQKKFAWVEPLRGDRLLFTTKSPGVTGTHLIDLRKMNCWFDFGAIKFLNLRPLD